MINKLKSLEEWRKIVADLQAQGKKVVFTNGCFDVLHVGHIRYLQEACTLGDFLLIGLNSDASVKKNKGNDRPLNNELERAELLAALTCVDGIVIFGEDTPIELLKALKPAIDVKGGDYTVEQLPEAQTVQNYGGEVKILSLVPYRSTTRIIELLIQQALKDKIIAGITRLYDEA
jgi:rfaE bifunctional protein nucleotidyltransferase chain/domain